MDALVVVFLKGLVAVLLVGFIVEKVKRINVRRRILRRLREV